LTANLKKGLSCDFLRVRHFIERIKMVTKGVIIDRKAAYVDCRNSKNLRGGKLC
jgi:hypothetical protein